MKTQTQAVQALLAGALPIIAAAGDYAAADILSESTSAGSAYTFTGLAESDGGGIICRAVVNLSVAAATTRLRLWLFTANPSASALNDNAALSIVAADRLKQIGFIDFPALVNIGTISFAQNTDIRLPFQTAAGVGVLYGILQTLDAFTNESASMTLRLELQSIRI